MSTEPIQEYSADDRGNVVDFYFGDEQIACLDREAGDKANEKTWDGGEDVTKWAIGNGYKEEIEEAKKI